MYRTSKSCHIHVIKCLRWINKTDQCCNRSKNNKAIGCALMLFLIIFLWTPPHFWALALYRVDDYRKSGLPMLPVTHGSAFTRLHILLYTIVLTAACLMPVAYGMSGWFYGVVALVLSLGFIVYAWRLWKAYSDQLARKTFRFSLIHLSVLFAALLIDHYIRGWF